jgi:DNA-binding transcriptional LysR family regulator
MNLQNLNFNELRVFIRVFEKKSMTEGARELHLTQSGVSQHIKNLEASLEMKLFDRIQRRLMPTAEARDLYDSCRKSLVEIQGTLDRIRGEQGQLRGKVRLAAPYEFGKNILGPALGSFLKGHPDLKFHLELGFSSDFLAPLLKGDLEAAVIDAFATHPSLDVEKIYEENLELCFSSSHKCPAASAPMAVKKEFLLQQKYVDYNKSAPIIDKYLRHHFGKIQGAPQVVATSGQAQILAGWVQTGLGAAILPHHFLQGQSGRELRAFPIGKSSLKNPLYLATLRGRKSRFLDVFKKAFIEKISS